MNRSTLRTISKICLVFAILWFVGLVVLEVHYVFSVLRQEANLRHYHLLRMIYEEQIEGINFILVIIFLVPGMFAWLLHIRFRQEH
jgi:hypothetical protein